MDANKKIYAARKLKTKRGIEACTFLTINWSKGSMIKNPKAQTSARTWRSTGFLYHPVCTFLNHHSKGLCNEWCANRCVSYYE